MSSLNTKKDEYIAHDCFIPIKKQNISMKNLLLVLFVSVFLFSSCTKEGNEKVIEVDICVYGGNSAGIIAAYTAKMQGKSVIIIEPRKNLGGLTTGGLGATDIGNKYAITGLGKDFYRRVGSYYDKFEQWTFEPHVASKVFDDLIKEANLDIRLNRRLVSVQKEDEWIREITIENSENPEQATNQIIRAKMFIDATYEGDLMAKSGVSYAVGREDNSLYGESFNGVQLSDFHQLPDGIDPYVIPGDSTSGLLWGISTGGLKAQGSGDDMIQAFNFRLALTKDKSNQIPFTLPEEYKPDRYELLARIIAKEKWETIHSSFTVDTLPTGEIRVNHTGGFLIKDMPNGKTDFNNFGGFSTDMIGANHDYPEANYATREKIWKEHESYTKGLLYFLSHDERVPEHIRKEMQSWGYSKDEFKDLNGFSNQLYVREARRMIGDVVMNQNHCEGTEVVDDPIAMAAYQMDSHNIQRIVVNGMVKNEGDVQKRVPQPFPISYRSIVPKKGESKNLLVPVCLSASHIAFGSIRMEPVFMVLGQAAATAAVQAIDEGVAVQDLDFSKLQKELIANPLADGSRPEILVDNAESDKVVVTGNWKVRGGGYGPNQLIDDKNIEELKSVRFTPDLPDNERYEIYAYFSKNANRSSQTEVLIHDGSEDKVILLPSSSIKELGLSSGEWASIGVFDLPKGGSSFVEISNRNADGVVSADAIVWKQVK